MLEIRQIDFDYPDKPVLQAIQFTVDFGSMLHLRGENGSGKTTLLKLLAGLLCPDRGEIHYQGRSIIDDLSSYQSNLCYISHKPGISLLLTIAENYQYGLQEINHNHPLNTMIKQFALDGFEHTPCGLLSAGQRRRAGLLRLLLSNARIWLLDEPFVSLDHRAVDGLLGCMKRHLANHGIIIITSHQITPLQDFDRQEYCL